MDSGLRPELDRRGTAISTPFFLKFYLMLAAIYAAMIAMQTLSVVESSFLTYTSCPSERKEAAT